MRTMPAPITEGSSSITSSSRDYHSGKAWKDNADGNTASSSLPSSLPSSSQSPGPRNPSGPASGTKRKERHNHHHRNSNRECDRDEVGESLARLLNEDPRFHFPAAFRHASASAQHQLPAQEHPGSGSRKRGRPEHRLGGNGGVAPPLRLSRESAPCETKAGGPAGNENETETDPRDALAPSEARFRSDCDCGDASSFRPLLGARNRHRIKLLVRCAWIVLKNLRPREDLFGLFGACCSGCFGRSNSPPLDRTSCLAVLRLLLVAAVLTVLGCATVSVGAVVGLARLLGMAKLVWFGVSSVLVDWNEVAGACPGWLLWIARTLEEWAVWFDRVVLFGNRWSGREWTSHGFVFGGEGGVSAWFGRSQSGCHSGTPQSSERTSYLWTLPPPSVLVRSPDLVPGNANANANPRAPRDPSASASSGERGTSGGSCTRADASALPPLWGKETAKHVRAIDYCFLALREEFIEQQYARLQRRKDSFRQQSRDRGDPRQKAVLERASSVVSLEDFRQEFVRDHPAADGGDVDENENPRDDTDKVTGISLGLQEFLEGEDSLDESEEHHRSGSLGGCGGTTASLPRRQGLRCSESRGAGDEDKANANANANSPTHNGEDDEGSLSDDGTTTDMNWMDVGHEIGMKLLSSSAVQNALASHDTVEKISTLKEKVDSHFGNGSHKPQPSALAPNTSVGEDSFPQARTDGSLHGGLSEASPVPREREKNTFVAAGRDSAVHKRGGAAESSTQASEAAAPRHHCYQLDPYAEALPVHPMWTSAAAAATVSPTHSFATVETIGTTREPPPEDTHQKTTTGSGSEGGGTVPAQTPSAAAFCANRIGPPGAGEDALSSAHHLGRQVLRLDDDLSELSPLSPPCVTKDAEWVDGRSHRKERSTSGKFEQNLELPTIGPTHESGASKGKQSSGKLSSKIVSKISKTSSAVSKTIFPRRRKPSPEDKSDPNDSREILIEHLSPLASKPTRPLLLPGVKIAVPLIPIRPNDPKERRSSRKRVKERFHMATVVSSKRICVYEKNQMPKSGNRKSNCLSITVHLDKCFLRNGHFATMTMRIMDDWGARYMPKHSKLPMGSCVATSFGLGVLVGWRVEDDCHIVRSLWQHRGSGSACAYLQRDSIHATVEAAVGFEVNTAVGHGTVVGYVNGGPDFRSGRYFVNISEEGRHHKQVLELNRTDLLSCPSAKFIPIVEHIRAAAQYQLQIDRYKKLQDEKTMDAEETNNRLWGEFSKHFNVLWKSFLRAIEEDDEFDDGMNEFIQSCVNFLNKLDDPNVGADGSENGGKDAQQSLSDSFIIHATDSSKSQLSKSTSSAIAAGDKADRSDSGFWLMNNMFGIFQSTRNSSGKTDVDLGTRGDVPVEGIEIQCTPRRQHLSAKNYTRAFAALRTLTRTVTIARAASADEPDFKIALSVCHEFLLFVKTVIKVQQKNMDHDSLEIWRSAWSEIVSVFGPVQQRLRRIGEGIAERMEKHGRRAKVRLLRFVDYILQDESLFLALEQGDWTCCAEQIEIAMVNANIIDKQSREHYRKTAQFLYNHFSSATSRSNGAAARNNQKLAQFLLAIQLFAAPRKAILELFLQDRVLEILERIFVRAFSKDELASRMLSIHCSNFQTLRRFRMLKDFTIAGKLWIPLLDAADEEFSWAVSKLPANAQEYLSPISSLFSLCVVQFHKMDEGDLTKDWLDFMMEGEAANIIHDLDMKLILALESFSRDIKDTMVVLPYYPSIEDDFLNLVDDINVDEFVKEASIALEDEGMLRDFIKEKATVAVERFLDYLPKMSIPVEKRDLGEGWVLTCRGAGGGDLTLTELNLKRENLTCQVLGGDSLLFPAADTLNELGTTPSGTSSILPMIRSMPETSVKVIEETSILSVIKQIILNAQRDGCWQSGKGGVHRPPSDKYAAAALGNLPVSSVLNCAIDLWRALEIDDDELLEVAIRDVSYQIQLKEDGGTDDSIQDEKTKECPALAELDSWPTMNTSSSADDTYDPVRHRFNPRVDPTVLFLEIKKLTFNLENFLFRIEKHESKRTIFDPVFEGTSSILVRNVLVRIRVKCVKGYIPKPAGRFDIPVPVLQLSDLDVSLEEVKLEVQDTGADWLLNKIVDGFGDRFAEIISANLCDQVRKQMDEALDSLNGYFEENPEFLLGVLDISLDDLEEMTIFV